MTATIPNLVLAHFLAKDPQIHSILTSVSLSDWWENRSQEDHFYNLAREIIYQQLSGKAAGTIFSRFEKLVGNKVKPENVVDLPVQSLRQVGLSYAKASYIKDLATKVLTGEVVLTNLASKSDEEIIAELIKVKGIGQWTAEMFLLFTLQRENIFSYGDLGLKKGFAKLYQIDSPSPEQIAVVVDRWHPYRSYGSIALWHFLDNR